MFTGLIEERGTITAIEQLPDAVRLTVSGNTALQGAQQGDSIAVSGVCLTVVEHDATSFTADVMEQTLAMTTMRNASVGLPVNLERAAELGSRLGGHIVQGHVDGTAEVLSISPSEDWTVIRFGLSRELAPLLVDKGSITVDGVSLTVSNISAPSESSQWFEVSLIPETLAVTTLGLRSVGDAVNLETDIIARQVARMLAFLPQQNAGA
ncbi:riboflavin synthase [Aurantimicrobium minutum]|jgi:riboflavin synthase|uniref:riboflavin synthase n=1 Tax=Aurantimicrobium minutum TaxID=708131 RepID=UPI0024740F0F|nr:riboflavin synthase [Aurantimicrobium minutum]MDH6207915.1 riboflavin synthase [Aurantimicrobium minutum]MDH6254545.1 riboflavin synthase [Aurantimicrobium minutum]MDH6410612.1 riboflavin synthase [Aurantimicrobium minutum]